MSRALPTLLAIIFLLAAALPVGANEPPKAPAPDANPADLPRGAGSGAVIPGEVLVKWSDPERGQRRASDRGLARVADLETPGTGVGLAAVLSTGGRPVGEVVAELSADPTVEYAEPNYVVTVAGGVVVNDPLTSGQYSLDRMRVRSAWGRSTGASNVVAVLDTGVQSGHPDLKGRVLKGYDFVNNDTSAADDNGHGTWVAGIIAARANDGYGIAGISWSDKILPVKIMNANGTGSTSDLTSGIVWAADNGATVINMSVGGFPYSKFVEDAVNYAWNKGAVLIGAAGNNGRLEDFYPASYANVISVSATQVDDEFSHWSSYGPKVDVSAPGSSVLTTNCTASACPNRSWGSHTYISGTSFATPNVAGAVALIKARYPGDTPSQITSRLFKTVDDLGYAGRDDRYGRGRVNAYRALGATVAQPGTVTGDALEGNNSPSLATPIPLDQATRPTIHPAGDVDWFAVDAPRAGRLDVRVTGVVDSRDYPWNRSSLPIDAIVELYSADGTFLQRVDKEWESGTELAQQQVAAGTRILVRVLNYYANGSTTPYSITPTFVDNVAPTVTWISPPGGSSEISRSVTPVARFSEPVKNVSGATVRLRDMTTLALVPASVTYDGARREARLKPGITLDRTREYRFELTTGITDVANNALATSRARWTTTGYTFGDIATSPHADAIEWIYERGITTGCGGGKFCPTRKLTRGEAATFLARALDLPPAATDYFSDDGGNVHHDAINRIAQAGITTGCGEGKFCPSRTMTRAEMAAFVARGFALPSTTIDYFTDDDGIKLEDSINRLAAAGVTTGCTATTFCPANTLNRGSMASFLHRALTR